MEFDEEYWWQDGLEELHFRGRDEEGVVLFRVTQISINDYFELPDTRDEATQAFEDNREWFEGIATRLSEEYPDQSDIYLTEPDLRVG